MSDEPEETWGNWEDRTDIVRFHKNDYVRQNFKTFHANLVATVLLSYVETEWGLIEHLSLRRHDDQPMLWAEKQRAKNELGYANRTAIEVFPPQSQLVDAGNMYHLWVLPDGFKLPFSL